MLEVVRDSPMLAQLLTNRHLRANQFSTGEKVSLGGELTITPLQVPHRDDHSDTHAFLIEGAAKKLLFLPDHDSWQMTLDIHQAAGPLEWFRSLFVDIVLIDGTFWSADELGGKAADIGHPPVEETLALLGDRGPSDPRVVFIHLNHTNPLHDESSAASAKVRAMGWEIARQPMTFGL
jgi:pyrroloquinoline quinone biosynthesis protein B